MTAHHSGRGDERGIAEFAAQLRVDSIRASTTAGSGHPTSAMSAADLMAVLFARHFRYDWHRPDHPGNDHLVFSKGHASPLLYSMFTLAGALDDADLVNGYRMFGSPLEGHPRPVLPWVDVATGSLGQGLPYGVGIALAAHRLDHSPSRVWVLCGDSEMSEGSIWEALDKASYYQLANLTTVVDINRLGQRGETELGWDADAYARRVAAFGCHPILIDGHDLAEINAAYTEAASMGVPTVILARTHKGHGFSEVEDVDGWHGKPFPQDMADRAIAELGGERHLTAPGQPPEDLPERPRREPVPVTLPTRSVGEKVATRRAYGEALAAIGARPDVVALDGEVSNSTYANIFAQKYPDRFFEMFIAEQQMVAAAVGMAVRGYRPFASTFAAFLTRAHDFVRMAAVAGADIVLCGSHAGVEIGADGPSQMGLDDLAMMRATPGSTVVYPADANSAAHLLAQLADRPGIGYMRTTRGSYPVLYGPDEKFPIGGSKILRSGEHDQVTLIGAGITTHQCLAAADLLAERGIPARVIDLYSVKPVDTTTVVASVGATDGRVVVAEDHYPEGGVADAVNEALITENQPARLTHLAVREVPGSGSPTELLDHHSISGRAIADAAVALVPAGAY